VVAGAALYTAYRDKDTIFNSSDLVSGVFEYMRKGGGTSTVEVGLGILTASVLAWRLLKQLQETACVACAGPDCAVVHAGLSQVSRLQKNVDDLQHALLKSLHDRQPTVIYAGQGKSGYVSPPYMTDEHVTASSTVWMLPMQLPCMLLCMLDFL
jgi:hypothetical protein